MRYFYSPSPTFNDTGCVDQILPTLPDLIGRKCLLSGVGVHAPVGHAVFGQGSAYLLYPAAVAAVIYLTTP
jgi:hypothetical protein